MRKMKINPLLNHSQNTEHRKEILKLCLKEDYPTPMESKLTRVNPRHHRRKE